MMGFDIVFSCDDDHRPEFSTASFTWVNRPENVSKFKQSHHKDLVIY